MTTKTSKTKTSKTKRSKKPATTETDGTAFGGWPSHTYRWLDELADNNDKAWFDANRAAFDEMNAASKAFVVALADRLDLDGTPKVWRIHRDQRFSKGEPYKTEHDGGVIDDAGMLHGFRLQSSGVTVAFGVGGIGGFAKPQLARFRTAITDPGAASDLADRLEAAAAAGFELGEPELKRPLKELGDDHPHPDLSRHKSLFLTKVHDGRPTWLFEPAALDHIVGDLRATEPVREWVASALA